jgi:glycosyltransferase involved in cell wall biosynthesis
MPRVSVIMPAYNVAPYIGASVASARAQTFTDLEILVVDDGSTDGTAHIAAEMASRDSRIRLLSKPNGGISTARNQALQRATGEVLALLDSDDLWEPDYLAAQLAVLDARPDVDLVTSNAWYLGSRLDGQLARPHPDPRPEPTLESIIADETAVFIMTVFRRRVYETIGGFDETFRTNEDYDYWLRATAAGFAFARNDTPLGRYRRRDDSLSASDVRMLQGILRVYGKLRPHLSGRPRELALLDGQVRRFERELAAAEARAALETGDACAIRETLGTLYAQRGGVALGAARLLAHWAPGLLARAYQHRRARQEAHA